MEEGHFSANVVPVVHQPIMVEVGGNATCEGSHDYLWVFDGAGIIQVGYNVGGIPANEGCGVCMLEHEVCGVVVGVWGRGFQWAPGCQHVGWGSLGLARETKW